MKIVLLFSGGIDSTVLLAQYVRACEEVHCLTVDYEQRHKCEVEAAEKICKFYDVPQTIIKMGSLKRQLWGASDSFLVNDSSNLVVPARNMILISLATALAESLKYNMVSIGVNYSDAGIFPDCGQAFINKMFDAVLYSSQITLTARLAAASKAEIIELGKEVGIPFGMTWSCYDPQKDGGTCGVCLPCIDREENGL